MVFPVVIYGCESGTIKRAGCRELMPLNCGVGEDFWESLGLKVDPTSPSQRRSVLNIHWKDWCWSWSSNTLATWCQEPTHWKRPWYWERLMAGGEEGDRGWDGWMASPTQWTWTSANSWRWWRAGKRGALQPMWSQSDTTKRLNNNKPTENCASPYSSWAALMSKLKCFYRDSNAFLLVLFWMKNNACPPPPSDNGKGEQRAEKRERCEKAGLEREEKSPPLVIGPDLLLCGLWSPSVNRKEGRGDRVH